jgi:hypothetical protein
MERAPSTPSVKHNANPMQRAQTKRENASNTASRSYSKRNIQCQIRSGEITLTDATINALNAYMSNNAAKSILFA